jgi:uncharacterized protein YggU (UPF0235/DUF167 family)
VRVLPRAGREAIAGVREGALVVKLKAAPVDGAANAALTRLLGKTLDIRPSAIQLVRGAAARDKLLRLEGAAADDVRRRLNEAIE